jgi:hypothetical protein
MSLTAYAAYAAYAEACEGAPTAGWDPFSYAAGLAQEATGWTACQPAYPPSTSETSP